MSSRNIRTFFTVAMLAGLVVGGFSFFKKLWDFSQASQGGEMPGFAGVAVIPYAIASFGFLFLILWTFVKGHYKDIEAPKYRMLEDLDNDH